MKKSDIFKKYHVNLDLAVEAHEVVRGEAEKEIPGVRQDIKKYENTTVNVISITDSIAEEIMGRPIGNYITIDAPAMRINNKEVHNEFSQVLAKELEELIKINQDDTVLIVGLGNWHATPDALGPQVVDYALVTRHLHDHAPEELTKGLRPVCALSPGVLGITGIETAEIIQGVVEKVKPSLIIAIDALASQSVDRIGTTIQLADTGIKPGSGIGNKRIGINKESMGVPVIAIGVPTVVHAAVIAQETIHALVNQLKPTLPHLDQSVTNEVVENSIDSVLNNFASHLMVTPKEIDELIQNTSKIIAYGLSQALHPSINKDNYLSYIQ